MFFKSIQVLIFSFSTISVFVQATNQCTTTPFSTVFGLGTNSIPDELKNKLTDISNALKYIRGNSHEYAKSTTNLQVLQNVLKTDLNNLDSVTAMDGSTQYGISTQVIEIFKGIHDELKNIDTSLTENDRLCMLDLSTNPITDQNKVSNIVNAYKSRFQFILNFEFTFYKCNIEHKIILKPKPTFDYSYFNSKSKFFSNIKIIKDSVNQINVMNDLTLPYEALQEFMSFKKSINILILAAYQGDIFMNVNNQNIKNMPCFDKMKLAYASLLKELEEVVYRTNGKPDNEINFYKILKNTDDNQKLPFLNEYMKETLKKKTKILNLFNVFGNLNFEDNYITSNIADTTGLVTRLNGIPMNYMNTLNIDPNNVNEGNFDTTKTSLSNLNELIYSISALTTKDEIKVGNSDVKFDVEVLEYFKYIQRIMKNVVSQNNNEKICDIIDSGFTSGAENIGILKQTISSYKSSLGELLYLEFTIESKSTTVNNKNKIEFTKKPILPMNYFDSKKKIFSFIRKIEKSVNQINEMRDFEMFDTTSTQFMSFQNHITTLILAFYQGDIIDKVNDNIKAMTCFENMKTAYTSLFTELNELVHLQEGGTTDKKIRFYEILGSDDKDDKKLTSLKTYLQQIKTKQNKIQEHINDVLVCEKLNLKVEDVVINTETEKEMLNNILDKIKTTLTLIRDVDQSSEMKYTFENLKTQLPIINEVRISIPALTDKKEFDIKDFKVKFDEDVHNFLKDISTKMNEVDSMKTEADKTNICNIVKSNFTESEANTVKVKDIIKKYNSALQNLFYYELDFEIETSGNMITIHFKSMFQLPTTFDSKEKIFSYLQQIEMAVNQIRKMNNFATSSPTSQTLRSFTNKIAFLKMVIQQGKEIFNNAKDKDNKMLLCSKRIAAYGKLFDELKQVVYGNGTMDSKTLLDTILEKTYDQMEDKNADEKKNALNTYLNEIQKNEILSSSIYDLLFFSETGLTVGDIFAIIFGILTFCLGILDIKLWHQTKKE